MKTFKFISMGNALFVRAFLLTVIMIIGGGNIAWGTSIFDYIDQAVKTGWRYTKVNSSGVVSTATLTPSSSYNLNNFSATSDYSWYTSTEKITITSGQSIALSAKKCGTSGSATPKIEVQYSSDNVNWSTAQTVNPTDNTKYSTFTITNNIVGNHYIRFEFLYVYIETIDLVDPPEGCPAPTSLTPSDITYNSASLSWTTGGEETTWQVKYNNGADFDPDEEGTMAGDDPVTINSYTLSGLSESTTYYAYVRAYIDSENQSAWTGPISFTTPEQYPAPVDLTLDSFTGTTATLSWTNGTGTAATAWEIKYSTSSGFNPASEGTLVNEISTNPYTITGLTAGTPYYARIRADYGSGNYSNWNATELSFTPIDAWETFFSGIPDTWYNKDDHWSTTRSGNEGKASATNSSYELRSPRLYMKKDETVSFDVTVTGSLTLKYYKTNRNSSPTNYATYTESGRKTFTAPSDDYYWLQFTGNNCAIDNFIGIEPADPEHLMGVSISTMLSSGTVGGDYKAKAKVSELGGVGETYTLQLIYDGVVVAVKSSQDIDGNRDEDVELTFMPTEEKTSKQMKFKIIYNDGDSYVETGWRNVTMSMPTDILDEASSPNKESSIYSKVVWFKYSAQNGWNTICVPFQLTDTYLEQIFGSGCTVYQIDNYSDGNLSFKKTTSYSVSTPYLVYTTHADEVADNILLKSVSVYASSSGWSSSNITQTKGYASFIGTFDPIAAPEMNGKYGITTTCKLGKGNSSASIKGYRAYIEVSDPSASRLSIVIDDEGETTDMGFVRMVDKDAKDVYNLQGQKVKKSGRGIYIVNGRKVVIK